MLEQNEEEGKMKPIEQTSDRRRQCQISAELTCMCQFDVQIFCYGTLEVSILNKPAGICIFLLQDSEVPQMVLYKGCITNKTQLL